MTYFVIVHKRAQKEVQRLPKKDQKRIRDAIYSLHFEPFAGKPLHGELKGERSLKIWPYRIIYTIEQNIVTVTVLRIGHRQGVYNK